MKRLGIVCFNELKYSPYADIYYKLAQNKIEYNILVWARNGRVKNSQNEKIVIQFSHKLDYNASLLVKAICFVRWLVFSCKAIAGYRFDKLVVLTTAPALLLSPVLLLFYRRRYILDIRDYFFNKSPFVRLFLCALVKTSYATTISSKGFEHFLPKSNYFVSHNVTSVCLEDWSKQGTRREGKIKLLYIGMISYLEMNTLLIKLVGNDDRVELHFWGNGGAEKELETFAVSNKYNNVFFHGGYNNAEKANIIKQYDVLVNIYGKTDSVRYALSNKAYDAMIYGKAILCTVDTYQDALFKEIGLGIGVDLENSDENISRIIMDYRRIDTRTCFVKAKKYLEQAMKDNDIYNEMIADFFRS